MSRAISKPNPVPSPTLSVAKKGSKVRFWFSLGISDSLIDVSGVSALEISLGRSQDLRVVVYHKDQRLRHRHQLLSLNIVL
jgi:hypothetical protein